MSTTYRQDAGKNNYMVSQILAGSNWSIVSGMQGFWSQIFLLPKQILHGVETICKRFLWNGEVNNKGKALIAWDTLCWPKTAGGKEPWEVNVKQASWIVRKILQAGHWQEERGMQVAEIMKTEGFSIKDRYKSLKRRVH
ncbi:uncharacterized protein LOC125845835 [Solanum stenotomum]|uniref:uncharacterized protein LOC125845835 n=1 Tax=Solanum stenotomum TaxID=172797 RepID=UPI0020D15C71|nr:uncharacterized protein LOC125845835 [Solanum stenotomum]